MTPEKNLPVKRHPTAVESPSLLLRGLDSLYVSYDLGTAMSAIDWGDLAYRKELMHAEHQRFAEIILGTETFALMPYGKKPYSYILVNKAFEIRLSERMHPTCHVQFFSEALWREGLDALEARFNRWCQSLELRPIRREVVARVDCAFDYHLPSIDFTADCFVSRAAIDVQHREYRKVQTFRMGQGEVVIRVYNKIAEIEQQSGKSWFFQLWGRNDEVWRIEIQLRGERLKQGGIRSLDDLRQLLGDLLREIAGNHTTLRRPNGDSNRSRWPLHPLWRQLQADIASMPQTGLVRNIDEIQPLEWLLYQAGKSIYGNMKNVAALLHGLRGSEEVPDLDRILAELPRILKKHHNAHLFRADVEQRIKKRELGVN